MNQDFSMNYFNQLITKLFEGKCEESGIITELSELARKNQQHKNNFYLIILKLFRHEKSIENKIKLFNLIDSLFKIGGQEYIDLFSPLLLDLFEATYLEANERDRIQLYKLFYTWKYIIDYKIQDKIHSALNFDQMKLKIMQLLPGTIERYDLFNEEMKIKIKNSAIARKMNEQMKHSSANANVNTYTHTYNNNSNNTDNSANALMMLVQQESQRVSKETYKEKEKEKKNNKKKDKLALSDDLFSDSSPSNEQFSDDDDDNENGNDKHYHTSLDSKVNRDADLKNRKIKLQTQKQFTEKDEEDERTNEKNINIQKIREKIKEKKSIQWLNQKRTRSPLSIHSQGYSSNQHKNPNKLPNHASSNNTSTNPNISMINPLTNPSLMNNMPTMPQYASGNNPFNQILQFAKINSNAQSSINSQFTPMKKFTTNLPLIHQINQQQNPILTQYQLNRPNQYTGSTIIPLNNNLSQTELSLQHFLLDSSVNIKESLTFFSSLSKFFIETYNQSKILPTTKSGIDLFKSKDLYEQIHKYTYNTLFLSLRNICAVCGFRTKIYSKFIEHLDIHFHYNYLKKNSNNKVLCRKEGCDKESWITNSYMKNSNAFTLNAILYYQNDSDQMANNMIYKPTEVEEDNEDLLYPVNYGEDSICFYCGDQLKKKYLSKYHYWFYVNVINAKTEDLITPLNADKEKVDKSNNETILIHESCVDEYVAKVSNQLRNKDKEFTAN